MNDIVFNAVSLESGAHSRDVYTEHGRHAELGMTPVRTSRRTDGPTESTPSPPHPLPSFVYLWVIIWTLHNLIPSNAVFAL